MLSDKLDSFNKFLKSISMLSLALLTSLIIIQIVARFFNLPFYLADEFTGILLAFLVFYALPSVTKERGHLKVEFLQDHMTNGVRNIIRIIIDLLTFVYLFSLTVLIYLLAYDSFLVNAKSQGMLRFPEYLPQAALLIGLVASVLFIFFKRSLKNNSNNQI